jgi:hypothetical protein
MKTTRGSVSHAQHTLWTVHEPAPSGMKWHDKQFKDDAAAQKYAEKNNLLFIPKQVEVKKGKQNAKRK